MSYSRPQREKVPLAAVWRTGYRGKGTSEAATAAVPASDGSGGRDEGWKWWNSGGSLKVGWTGFAEGGCEECERKESKMTPTKSWGLSC